MPRQHDIARSRPLQQVREPVEQHALARRQRRQHATAAHDHPFCCQEREDRITARHDTSHAAANAENALARG